jgi:hypothetical protein
MEQSLKFCGITFTLDICVCSLGNWHYMIRRLERFSLVIKPIEDNMVT